MIFQKQRWGDLSLFYVYLLNYNIKPVAIRACFESMFISLPPEVTLHHTFAEFCSMASTFPRVGSLLWVPAVGIAGLTMKSCGETYWFLYQFTWALSSLDGAQWRHPDTDQSRARAVGIGAACTAAAFTFGGFKYALDRILLPKAPSRTRLFDTLTADDRPLRLTAKSAWEHLGPSGSVSTWRSFGKAHGWHLLSSFLAGMWCVMLVPLVHAKAEASMCVQGAPAPPERRKRLLSDLQRRLDDARSGKKTSQEGSTAAAPGSLPQSASASGSGGVEIGVGMPAVPAAQASAGTSAATSLR